MMNLADRNPGPSSFLPRAVDLLRLLVLWCCLTWLAHAADNPLPASVDLGPGFQQRGLTPRSQGRRNTCSLFAITAIADFELQRTAEAPRPRLSEEFLIWAANEATDRQGDQTMFYEAIQGLNMLGICSDESLGYSKDVAYANDALILHCGSPGAEVPTVRFEAESMTILATDNCRAAPQQMTDFGGPVWSQSEQLYCRSTSGGSVDLGFDVTKAGRYRVRLLATAAPDYGQILVSLDGQRLDPVFDLYSGRISRAGSPDDAL